jgi:hypothetical protein
MMEFRMIPTEELEAAHVRCSRSNYEHWGLVLVREDPPILVVYPTGSADGQYPARGFLLSSADAETIAREIETWNETEEPGTTPTINLYWEESNRIAAL